MLSHYLAPLLVAVGAKVVLREPGQSGSLPWLAVGLVGIFLLLAPWKDRGSLDNGRLLYGSALGLSSAFFYAGSILFNKKLSASFSPSELIV